jgi:hypothetical protein
VANGLTREDAHFEAKDGKQLIQEGDVLSKVADWPECLWPGGGSMSDGEQETSRMAAARGEGVECMASGTS